MTSNGSSATETDQTCESRAMRDPSPDSNTSRRRRATSCRGRARTCFRRRSRQRRPCPTGGAPRRSCVSPTSSERAIPRRSPARACSRSAFTDIHARRRTWTYPFVRAPRMRDVSCGSRGLRRSPREFRSNRTQFRTRGHYRAARRRARTGRPDHRDLGRLFRRSDRRRAQHEHRRSGDPVLEHVRALETSRRALTVVDRDRAPREYAAH